MGRDLNSLQFNRATTASQKLNAKSKLTQNLEHMHDNLAHGTEKFGSFAPGPLNAASEGEKGAMRTKNSLKRAKNLNNRHLGEKKQGDQGKLHETSKPCL